MGQKTISGHNFDVLSVTRDSPTALLILEDGTVFTGFGFGAAATNVGELCFNTSMTGYQEIISDPSYAGQIITFTFPHIGNVGMNSKDLETTTPAALGIVVRQPVTNPANWRADSSLDDWLLAHNLPGISGIDTRALTRRIRDLGAPRAALCNDPNGKIDAGALCEMVKSWPGLKNMDLTKSVTLPCTTSWDEGSFLYKNSAHQVPPTKFSVVAMDFGRKHNILRCLKDAGCAVTVVPADTSADSIMARQPYHSIRSKDHRCASSQNSVACYGW